jgi:ElaB/YqjD/DUF883 family membrane-anchored ribosome-binding protein
MMMQGNNSDLSSITHQIKDGLKRGKFTASELNQALKEKGKRLAQTTDHFVHENPWAAIGVGLGTGILLGLLLQSSKSEPERFSSAKNPRPERDALELLKKSGLFALSVMRTVQALRALR